MDQPIVTSLSSMYDSFATVTAGRLELASLSKATLADLSHVLENIMIDEQMPGVILTGFQTGANWNAELARYERLVEPTTRSVAVFTNETVGDLGEVMGFLLEEGSGLRQEWFVIVLTDEFSCALFGVDNPALPSPVEEMDRLFDAAWTFDAALVGELCALVVDQARRSDPDRADRVAAAVETYRPRKVSVRFEQRFTRLVFEALESGRRRWRRQLVKEREVRERLQAAELKVRRLERLAGLGTTVSSLAHEINNPLNAIGMGTELIRLELLDLGTDLRTWSSDPKVLAWAATVERLVEDAGAASVTVERIGRMVHGMLDLVRSSEVRCEPIDVVAWLRPVCEELSMVVSRQVVLVGPGPQFVSAESDRLRHIVTNLVRNAAEADRGGSAIEVSVRRGGDRVLVHCADHGRGIDASIAPGLFRPFVTSKGAEGGFGLGLALSRRFAEDMEGSLDLEATGPDGTTFVMGLRPSDPGMHLPAEAADAGRSGEQVEASARPSVAVRSALLLDDDEIVRATLGRMLERLGWAVTSTPGPAEAVEQLRERAFDVVLVDYHLTTAMTFREVVAMLDGHRAGTRERVIVITGSLLSELGEDIAPVLLKPFSVGQLEAMLQESLSRHA